MWKLTVKLCVCVTLKAEAAKLEKENETALHTFSESLTHLNYHKLYDCRYI